MMQHIQGTQCHQLQMNSLESKIASENPVRFVDAFAEYISLELVGFMVKTLKSEGVRVLTLKSFLKFICIVI
jgi:hypothetical protein